MRSYIDSTFYDQVSELILLVRRRGMTLALAESCTGGLLSAELARHPGVSDMFSGGVVTYSNESKTKLLNVPAELIHQYGAVSSQVVGAMALGALNNVGADWAISISGVAGPTGGTPDKPVGTVWFGIAHGDELKTVLQRFTGDRRQIQEQAVLFAVELFNRELGEVD